jgi:hypothetical protein
MSDKKANSLDPEEWKDAQELEEEDRHRRKSLKIRRQLLNKSKNKSKTKSNNRGKHESKDRNNR